MLPRTFVQGGVRNAPIVHKMKEGKVGSEQSYGAPNEKKLENNLLLLTVAVLTISTNVSSTISTVNVSSFRVPINPKQ